MQQKIGIIISMFPEVHETFILRELLELETKGIIFVYSLQYPRDEVIQDGAQRLKDSQFQSAPASPRRNSSPGSSAEPGLTVARLAVVDEEAGAGGWSFRLRYIVA